MNLIFKKKYEYASGSLTALALNKFRKNPLSFSALLFILLLTCIAFLGYLITPDPTPMSNRQVLEIGAKKPGFSIMMLKVVKNEQMDRPGMIHDMVFGRVSPFRLIPVQSHRFEGKYLVVEEYAGEAGVKGIETAYELPDVVFPLDTQVPVTVVQQGDSATFRLVTGEEKTVSLKDLQDIVLKDHFKSYQYLFGTDQFGRDLLSRLMIGTRVSLAVGFISVLISLLIGITIGSLGGFFRGWVDQVVMWLINVVWSIPTLLLVIAITFALGKGFWQVFIAVGLTMWVEVARLTRGQIIAIREKEYIEAARALGYKNFRIITRHILPNILGPVIVISAANFASAILLEAGLSFLGIGVQPPMPSWGSMIRENYAYIILDASHLALLPGIAIMLTVLAFMIVGNGLRDALDVRAVEKRDI